jgi:hypothetical protein
MVYKNIFKTIPKNIGSANANLKTLEPANLNIFETESEEQGHQKSKPPTKPKMG